MYNTALQPPEISIAIMAPKDRDTLHRPNTWHSAADVRPSLSVFTAQSADFTAPIQTDAIIMLQHNTGRHWPLANGCLTEILCILSASAGRIWTLESIFRFLYHWSDCLVICFVCWPPPMEEIRLHNKQLSWVIKPVRSVGFKEGTIPSPADSIGVPKMYILEKRSLGT